MILFGNLPSTEIIHSGVNSQLTLTVTSMNSLRSVLYMLFYLLLETQLLSSPSSKSKGQDVQLDHLVQINSQPFLSHLCLTPSFRL